MLTAILQDLSYLCLSDHLPGQEKLALSERSTRRDPWRSSPAGIARDTSCTIGDHFVQALQPKSEPVNPPGSLPVPSPQGTQQHSGQSPTVNQKDQGFCFEGRAVLFISCSFFLSYNWQDPFVRIFIYVSPQQVFSISLCVIFYFPWHRHQVEGTNGFYCLFRKTQAKWGKQSCPSFKIAEVVLNPVPSTDALPHDHRAPLVISCSLASVHSAV